MFKIFPGLTEPVLIRLDVDSKLSDQIKVKTVWLKHDKMSVQMILHFSSHRIMLLFFNIK